MRSPVKDSTNTELFAKVLGTPLALAEEMVNYYNGNLEQIAKGSPNQIRKIRGIGDKRSERLAAAFELGKRLARFRAEKVKIKQPIDVANLMMPKLRYLQKEVVVILCLDTKGAVTKNYRNNWGKLLGESQISEGTLNSTIFHPRDIFRYAIEESANSIIIVHNHPSGDPQPSSQDISSTKQLIEAGNQIGINVLDHIIIGDGVYCSLSEDKHIHCPPNQDKHI